MTKITNHIEFLKILQLLPEDDVLMAPVDGKVSLSLCQMLESEKKAAAAVSWHS